MAEVWKEEYHVIASDGQARDWLESLEEAKAELRPSDLRIEEVTYYHNDTKIVWQPGACDDCGGMPGVDCDCG